MVPTLVLGSGSSPCAGSAGSAAVMQQPGAGQSQCWAPAVDVEEQFNLLSSVPHLLQEDRDCLWLLLESCVVG